MQNDLLDQDSRSDYSFNSSHISSSISRTASIVSNFNLQVLPEIFMTPNIKTRSNEDALSEKTQSIQKPRIQIHSQKPLLQHSPTFQLGFFIGKNMKNVQLNQSKIKKAIHFFDDQQTTNCILFPSKSLFQFPQTTTNNLNQQLPQFSVPCFKNVGKNKKLQIDPNLLKKGQNFFDDDFEDTMFPKFSKKQIPDQTELLSFRKPTKVKKTLTNPKINEQNFMKTVNVNKKQKKQQVPKVEKKQIFDWNKFQISSKKLVCNKESFRMSSAKRSPKNKKRSNKKLNVLSISLNELEIQVFNSEQKLQQFKQRLSHFEETKFDHNKKDCRIVKCILCDLGIQDNELDRDKLENIFTQKLIIDKIDSVKFMQFYEQICFKLLKYETYFIQIPNKHLHPSNILVELHKKSKLIQAGTPYLGWIDFCINQHKFYHSFIAQVRTIYHNQKINTYFILLADGWSNIWAVVTQKNYLYKFMSKLNLLSKIFIAYWKHYSLSNVLSFCPKAKKGQKCIEIWYNSSIIVKHNMKLGKPKNLIFYRPLNLIRKQGGVIPTVQGLVVRMFCPNTSRPKSTSTSVEQNSFNENYVQILTPEGFSILIKFVLPTERSLAQLFRLYFKYHFYFLKIGQKDNFLQFNDEISKFFEFDKKDKNQYDPGLIQTLRKRYVNWMDAKTMDKLHIGKLYDIRLQGKQGLINNRIFVIDNGNQAQHNTNSFFRGSLLYQQYELEHIENSRKEQEGLENVAYYFKKTKFSNTLKSLPAIYQRLH